MKYFLFFILICLSFDSHSVEKLFVLKRIEHTENQTSFSLRNSSVLLFKEVWNSSQGIECSITFVNEKGNLECISKEGYKAQIVFDCSINSSEATAAYLFFGLIGVKGNNQNFYVWCQ